MPNIQEASVAKLNMQIRDEGAKQTRRRKPRERHLNIRLLQSFLNYSEPLRLQNVFQPIIKLETALQR